MKRRPRVVLELGVGRQAKKIVALALKHPNTRFVGVDKRIVDYGRELLHHGARLKPPNLEVRPKTDALEFMRRQRVGSFSHVFAHFTLQHLPHLYRQELVSRVFKAMQPRGRFTVLEHSPWKTQVEKELRAAGFRVASITLTPEQALKIGSEHSYYNYFRQKVGDVIKRMYGSGKEFDAELERRIAEFAAMSVMSAREPDKSRPEVHAAFQRVAARGITITGRKPFVLIYAVKE